MASCNEETRFLSQQQGCTKVINKLDHFNVIGSLGKGQFGCIEKVVDLDQNVFAAKILNDSGSDQELRTSSFQSEARILQLLEGKQCKHIIRFNKLVNQGKFINSEGVEKQVTYYTMELAEYGTILDFIIQNKINFSLRCKKQCFLQIAEGLEFLHQLGIVHQDLKIQNVVVSKSGIVKLIDFGCSVQNGVDGIDINNIKSPWGTRKYWSPEMWNIQKSKSSYQGTKAEIFALGVVLFELVFLQPPFQNFCQDYFLFCKNKKMFWDNWEQVQQIDESFKNLINLMLAENPSTRLSFQQIKEHQFFKQDLIANQEELALELSKIADTYKSSLEKYFCQEVSEEQLCKCNYNDTFISDDLSGSYDIQDCSQSRSFNESQISLEDLQMCGCSLISKFTCFTTDLPLETLVKELNSFLIKNAFDIERNQEELKAKFVEDNFEVKIKFSFYELEEQLLVELEKEEGNNDICTKKIQSIVSHPDILKIRNQDKL